MALYPLSAYYSTTLTPRISSYELLTDRILRMLGAPSINLEVACSSVFDCIAQACEWYTKYAGDTEEFLIFDSKLYTPGLGIKLDHLFNITPETFTENPNSTQILSTEISGNDFQQNYTEVRPFSGIYDYNLDTYRKVKSVQSFVEGTSTGINSLFTIEQSLAQQTYFAYALGNHGFDLVTWEIMKQWLEMRERVLAQKVYYRFDPRTQILRLLPEPRNKDHRYFGLIGCRVERPIIDVVKERWVFQYALALVKQIISNVRSKFGSIVLFGGGTLNGQDLMTQGREDQKNLEEELMYKVGEAEPLPLLIG